MRHRLLGLLAACALAIPGAATAQQPKTLRVVMHSDLKILDPIWTTAFIVRNHGYMIYDTLFALDGNLQIKPQMVDTWTVSPDKLTWTFTLRDGLEFHDGQPVTTEDVLASLKRWAVRDGLGQILWAKLADAKAIDAKTFQLVLKAPTGVVLQALAKPSGNPFIMPKRVAETSAGDQIKEFVGSGPFIFKADEWTRLRNAFADETDEAKRKEIVEKIQLRAAEVPTHAFLGQYNNAMAIRKEVAGSVVAPVPVFWNIEKK